LRVSNAEFIWLKGLRGGVQLGWFIFMGADGAWESQVVFKIPQELLLFPLFQNSMMVLCFTWSKSLDLA
jgi:hypothetical protein